MSPEATITGGAGSPVQAKVDSAFNSLRASNYPPTLKMYSGISLAPFAAEAGTKPFFLIEGSASAAIRLWRLIVTCPTLTAVAYHAINVEKYSAAASSGTGVDTVFAPWDSASAAVPTFVSKYYTAGPTAGAKAGILMTRRFLSQAATAAAAGSPPDPLVFDFDGQLFLRGIEEGVGLAFAAAPATVVTLQVEAIISVD